MVTRRGKWWFNATDPHKDKNELIHFLCTVVVLKGEVLVLSEIGVYNFTNI